MDKENLNIGDLVTGKVNEDLDGAFTGTVEIKQQDRCKPQAIKSC